MKNIISLITNYYWLFIIIAIFFGISLLGYYVSNRKDKADEIGEKMDDQLIKEAEKKYEESKNK